MHNKSTIFSHNISFYFFGIKSLYEIVSRHICFNLSVPLYAYPCIYDDKFCYGMVNIIV